MDGEQSLGIFTSSKFVQSHRGNVGPGSFQEMCIHTIGEDIEEALADITVPRASQRK